MGDYHRDADQWNRDVQRRADLEAAGWRVVEIVARDLANPARILALVNAAIALSAR
jgi:very-short-patch-repair endonuclease